MYRDFFYTSWVENKVKKGEKVNVKNSDIWVLMLFFLDLYAIYKSD